MTEIEVKISTDEAGYKKFIQNYALNITGVLHQMNIFFNTYDTNLKRSMRLRRIKSAELPVRWVFTSKGPGSIVDGVSTHSEIEEAISDENANLILSDTKNLYKYIPKCIADAVEPTKDSEYYLSGNFLSIRRVVPIGSFTVEADECTYPNGDKFYEFEVESTKPLEAKAEIQKILNDLGVKFEESKITKLKRLFSYPREQRINLSIQ
ncbi:Adenylate cyclase family protein [Trichomonas vaginalis G3]|uniref:Adenylate cyclase family protein n=1 Tax=Trichomonas vaginalis (strain ATCC PRA-98 / G3) TaxID=412133 RepID=A2E793_TRIV3|nr:triphosphate tunnel metalloenzyme family [Trichomonas vaginalis G3]EAY11490.1 Adenylate cyclase family protein [Trichomonas vaginalis G3]KAI5526748.1 triphosphate tunnel metalloenzyme family [Trichomonas vaginalis G3]|eukprot:XP_001323713.1 Adenylate cyclase family protein [Trichomonas vaginalis G3]